MKRMYFLLLTAGMAVSAFGQFGLGGSLEVIEVDKQKEVEKLINEQTLLVILKEPEKFQVNKIKYYEGDVQAYLDGIEDYNQMLKGVFKANWTLTDRIEYMTQSELGDVRRKERKKYTLTRLSVNSLSSSVVNGGRTVQFASTDAYSDFGLLHYAGMVSGRLVNVHLPYMDASEGDLVWAVTQMQNFLKAALEGMDAEAFAGASFEKNGNLLAAKTLLIDENDLNGRLNERYIQSFYPHSFKIVNRAAIDSAVLSKDPDYLVLKLLPVEVTNSNATSSTQYNSQTGLTETKQTRYENSNLYYNHLVTACENGALVSGDFLKVLSLKGIPPAEVNKESLKAYVENAGKE